MQTIGFKFVFKNLPAHWYAEALCREEKDSRWASWCLKDAKPTGEKSPSYDRGPHGVKEATGRALRKVFPRSSINQGEARSFDEFRRQFVERMQSTAIDLAAIGEDVPVPTNHVEEFWTSDHIKRLARALSRPRKTNAIRRDHFLAFHWQSHSLFKLDREELAAFVNRTLHTKFKSKAVWEAAYRLGLTSERTPGPKPDR